FGFAQALGRPSRGAFRLGSAELVRIIGLPHIVGGLLQPVDHLLKLLRVHIHAVLTELLLLLLLLALLTLLLPLLLARLSLLALLLTLLALLLALLSLLTLALLLSLLPLLLLLAIAAQLAAVLHLLQLLLEFFRIAPKLFLLISLLPRLLRVLA